MRFVSYQNPGIAGLTARVSAMATKTSKN